MENTDFPPVVFQSFIHRENEKLERELHKAEMDGVLYAQIYAARQALSWALDPNAFASPYAFLLNKRGDNSVNIEMVELAGDGPAEAAA
jgi:hypothetical protein